MNITAKLKEAKIWGSITMWCSVTNNDINVCDYHIDFEGVFQQRQVNLCFEKIKEKYENDKGKRTA